MRSTTASSASVPGTCGRPKGGQVSEDLERNVTTGSPVRRSRSPRRTRSRRTRSTLIDCVSTGRATVVTTRMTQADATGLASTSSLDPQLLEYSESHNGAAKAAPVALHPAGKIHDHNAVLQWQTDPCHRAKGGQMAEERDRMNQRLLGETAELGEEEATGPDVEAHKVIGRPLGRRSPARRRPRRRGRRRPGCRGRRGPRAPQVVPRRTAFRGRREPPLSYARSTSSSAASRR